MNPLIPGAVDVVWIVITIVAFALAIVALVSLSRSRAVSPRQALAWALLIVLVPILGPLAWLAGGRRATALRA